MISVSWVSVCSVCVGIPQDPPPPPTGRHGGPEGAGSGKGVPKTPPPPARAQTFFLPPTCGVGVHPALVTMYYPLAIPLLKVYAGHTLKVRGGGAISACHWRSLGAAKVRTTYHVAFRGGVGRGGGRFGCEEALVQGHEVRTG